MYRKYIQAVEPLDDHIVCRRREIMHELAFAQIASLRYNKNTKIFAKKEKVGKRDGGWL